MAITPPKPSGAGSISIGGGRVRITRPFEDLREKDDEKKKKDEKSKKED
jgi:hypothetical protein